MNGVEIKSPKKPAVGMRIRTKEGNMTGAIIAIEADDFAVRHDEWKIGFHTCAGRCEPGHGWWYKREEVVLL